MKNLLSIQSHTVHGYVGNRASTFPLQSQGWDVDVLNTVNFSNHTGYGQVSGTTTSGSQITELFNGLMNLNMEYNALLTGYIPGAESVCAVGHLLHEYKSNHPETIWLLDPVMGDQGQLYVDEDVVPAYRQVLSLKSVDIITPNQFEVELLVDFKITDIKTLRDAIQHIHTKYAVKYVIISSLELEDLDITISNESSITTSEKIIYAATSFIGDDDISIFKIPSIDSYFTGVGDLFSALLLDRLYSSLLESPPKLSLNHSVSQVLSVMHEVLITTNKLALRDLEEKGVSGKNRSIIGDRDMKYFELRIIECRDLYSKRNEFFNFIDL